MTRLRTVLLVGVVFVAGTAIAAGAAGTPTDDGAGVPGSDWITPPGDGPPSASGSSVAAGDPSTAADENATLDHEGDAVTLEAAPGQVVRGTTSLPACSRVTVQLRSSGGRSPFVHQKHVTTGPDGRFAAVFDLSGADPNGSFIVSVRGGGESLASRVDGELVPSDGTPEDPPDDVGGPRLAAGDPPEGYRGEVIALPVDLGVVSEATLRVGGESVDYEVVATLRDGDGDGRVVALFDTAAAGTDAPTVTARDGADEVTVDAETTLDRQLAAGDYPVSVSCDGRDGSRWSLHVRGDGPTETAGGAGETPTPHADPRLGSTIFAAHQTETVPLPVWFGNASELRLRFGGESVNYEVVATLRDGDGDGRVVALFDTAAAGTDAPTVTARDGADEVTVDAETELDARLDPGDYPISIFRPGDTGADEEVDIGTLVLQDGTPRPAPSPTATPTPTPTEPSPGTPGTPDGDGTPSSSTDPVVLLLGGIAAVGIGAAATLTAFRR